MKKCLQQEIMHHAIKTKRLTVLRRFDSVADTS